MFLIKFKPLIIALLFCIFIYTGWRFTRRIDEKQKTENKIIFIRK